MKRGSRFIGAIAMSIAAAASADEVIRLEPIAPNAAPTRAVKKPVQAGGYYDANDFYYYQGKRIPLLRSLTEYAVQFNRGVRSATRRHVVGSVVSTSDMTDITRPGDGTLSVVRLKGAKQWAGMDQAIQATRRRVEVRFSFPVYIGAQLGNKMLLTDEIVVKLEPEQVIEDLTNAYASYGLEVVERIWGTEDQYLLRIRNPKAVNPLEVANALALNAATSWAEPNFVQEYQKSFRPNDPLFPNQWHLDNQGQGGATPDADVDAPEAWDIQRGTGSIVIAVIDDGVEIGHEDLDIFSNPGETPANGIDDDGNGLIDDVNGWDFFDNDNDPNPAVPGDRHGQAVAGVAAARGNNATGVSGSCQNCKVLPVKIFRDFSFAGTATAANAIRYASTLAHVLNNSWSGGSPSTTIQSAIQDATTNGRNGLGSVPLFASGNSASGYSTLVGSIPAGTHRFKMEYTKDSSVDTGDDTAWMAWVLFPSGELVDFESGLPAGWTTSGDALWSSVNDATHADEGMCFTHAAKAGTITHNQRSTLEVVKTMPAGDIFFFVWVSSEPGFDGLTVTVDFNNNGSVDVSASISQVPFVNQAVGFPAAFPEAVAVGASSDRDCRSYYSQFGPNLDFVAPSNSGLNLGITTTDRTGGAGYDPTNYTSTFGGTSSATPLAAGVAGLILSHNRRLRWDEVRRLLRDTADKVGPAPFDAQGRNDRYGFGRINAHTALGMVKPPAAAIVPTLQFLLDE